MTDFDDHTWDVQDSDIWADTPQAFRTSNEPLATPWEAIFGPLRNGTSDNLVIIGQIGQSLDGKIATASGDSHYINASAGLTHLHRLRALVDAVVIGIGTAISDDPQLTVRRVSGPNPVRVVIDPRGRLSRDAKLLTDDGTSRLIFTTTSAKIDMPAGVEIVAIEAADGKIAPAAIAAALASRGLRRVLIEGGAKTVSGFLEARCLDRLHVMVAPIILGSGRSGIDLPIIQRVSDALRPSVRSFRLSDEILYDCDLSAYRDPIGNAKKSM